jgi:hypothetical protein
VCLPPLKSKHLIKLTHLRKEEEKKHKIMINFKFKGICYAYLRKRKKKELYFLIRFFFWLPPLLWRFKIYINRRKVI